MPDSGNLERERFGRTQHGTEFCAQLSTLLPPLLKRHAQHPLVLSLDLFFGRYLNRSTHIPAPPLLPKTRAY